MKSKSLILSETKKVSGIVLATILYSLAVNLFLVPADIYCGGLFGACQVVRTLLVDGLGLNLKFDIAAPIYYLLNIPILLYGWFKISRSFLLRTLICISVMTVSLSVIPIRAVLPMDRMASCLTGGILTGIGAGFYLRLGASGGGFDVIGLMLIRINKGKSIGKINLIINIMLFVLCGYLFDIDVVIYSVLYSAVFSVVVDKVYTQNINVEVKIITKNSSDVIEKAIMEKLGRGATLINSTGAYTKNKGWIIYVVLSKYELPYLRAIVKHFDPNAFVVASESVEVYGNYTKKLQ